MSDRTKIEWADATWNPVRGCTKVSPGCKHCYAETLAERFRGVKGHPYEQGFDLRLVPEKLTDPFSWSGPRRVFVNSMSDLFHKDVPVDYIREVGEVMVQANWHTFLILTKRSERMRDLLQPDGPLADLAQHPHLWWGVSVENRKHGLPRVDHLQSIPTRGKRFLSIEPLLEDLGELDLKSIDWAIVGGESGHGARPMEPDWVRSIRDQCQTAKIPFFFKQWGGRQKSKAGRTLDGREHSDSPSTDGCPTPDRTRRRVIAADVRRRVAPTVITDGMDSDAKGQLYFPGR